MGAMESWLRKDEKVGSVDLSVLALPEESYERPEHISFLTKSRLWYTVTPMSGTEITGEGLIYPVRLKRYARSGPYENILDAAISIPNEVKNWVIEGRHFPAIGNVALLNEVVHEGESLTINGRETSALDIAWVTERVDPASGIRGGSGYGKVLPDGTHTLVMTHTVANF